jgi:hypothetical protein
MKRLGLIPTAAVVAIAALAIASPAAADFRVPIVACAEGPGAMFVPANTPLYFDSGWTSGTRGLVQDAVNNARDAFTYTINGTTTSVPVVFGPILQENLIFPGSWSSLFRVDFAPLAVGETETVIGTFGWAHPLVDLGLPTSNSGSGLLYFDLQPAGMSAFGPSDPFTCTVTGA